jgi:low molecular weight protein-tyrosine phosphatase
MNLFASLTDKPMKQKVKTRILFVCMGNICRSPTAQGVFQRLIEQTGLINKIQIDSAGTHAYHIGNSPDPRAQAVALRRGIDLSSLRARRIARSDYEKYDYILAMDQDNLNALRINCPPEHVYKLHLFLEFAPELKVNEVPDPYYGGSTGFEQVLDLVEIASEGLLRHLRQHALSR